MLQFLAKRFIKNYQNLDDPAVRGKYGTLSSIVGIAVNILLSVFKLLVGFLSGSMGILADGVNNLSDAGSSLVSMISFHISSKPADRDHPFGHARIEYVASMIVSFLILKVGFDLLADSVSALIDPSAAESVTFDPITFIVLGASIFMKLILALFYRSAAKAIDSEVMRASMLDSLMDCISTSAVLISAIVISLTDLLWLDALVGLGVSLLILVSGIRILNDTKNSILGEAPVQEIVEQIEEIVQRFPEAKGIHDLIVHNYGPSTFIASLHVEVDGKEDIFELHDAIDLMEKTLMDEMHIHCTIHMDPIVTNDAVVDELRAFALHCAKEIDERVTIHDFRAVVGRTHTNLIFDCVLPYESAMSPDAYREALCALVLEKRPNHYCVLTIDRG